MRKERDVHHLKLHFHFHFTSASFPLCIHQFIYPLTSHLSPDNDPLSSRCPTLNFPSYIDLPATIRVLARRRTFRGITIPATTAPTIQLDALTLPRDSVTLARTDGSRRTRDIRQRRRRARTGAIRRTERARSNGREIGLRFLFLRFRFRRLLDVIVVDASFHESLDEFVCRRVLV